MNLSADALKCRADRIEANKVRESKAKAKVKTAAPPGPKKAIAVNTNSAAARRLAAMRGGQGQHPASDGLPRAASEVSSVFTVDETDFDPFSSSSVPFDPFGSAVGSAPIAADLVGSAPTAATPANFFDAFSDSSVSDQLFSVTEGSAASSRPRQEDSFDPFSAQVADGGFESTACRSPTLPSRQFSMFSSSSRNPSIISSAPDDFFAPSSSSTSVNNSQNQEWSSIDADAFGYNDGDRGVATTTCQSSYGEVDFFNLGNEPQSSSISAQKPIPMKPPKPSSSSAVSEAAVSVEASRSAASRLFMEAASYADTEGAGSVGSPSKPSKPMKPKKQSDEQSPALIDFDTDSSIDYNIESSIAYATPSRAVPPKPSKRESISLIDFDYSETVTEVSKADTAVSTTTSGTTARRHINPFEEDLLEMPVAPVLSIDSKHSSSASLQADVLSLYDLPMSPPPIPTQAPPGIKPAKPSVMRPQYAAASSMNSLTIDARFGAAYPYPSAASPRPAQQQPYPPQQLQPCSPRYPTTPSTQRGGPMMGSSYDPFSSIQSSFGKQ